MTPQPPSNPNARPPREPDARLDDLLASLRAEPPAPLPTPEGFEAELESIGVGLDAGDAERLGLFLALMLRVNEAVNLTAVREPADAWTRHALDALTLLPTLAEIEPGVDGGVRVIDIGSGGGVPGLALACVMPEVAFTLLEPTAKKARWLETAAGVLGLSNVGVLAERAERAGRERGLRDGFDAAVVRAVGRLPVVVELTLPFVRPGGLALFVKGAQAEQELAEAGAALKALHGAHAGTIDTPTGRIVVVEKLRPTPRPYPRRDGEPKRAPIH